MFTNGFVRVVQDSKRQIGWQDNGLFRLTDERVERVIIPTLSSVAVHAIYEDRHGDSGLAFQDTALQNNTATETVWKENPAKTESSQSEP